MKSGKTGRLQHKAGLGVATRVAGGYVLLIALILLVAAIGITNIGTIRKAYDAVLDERIPRITELQKVQELLYSLNVGARDALLTSDVQKLALVFTDIEAGRRQAGEQLETLQKALEAEGTAQSLEVARQIGNDASGVLVGLVKFSRYLKADKREPALAALQDGIQPQLKVLSQHIGEYQQHQIGLLAGVKAEVARKEASVVRQTVALAAAALLVGALFAWWVVRSVVAPLREIKEATGFMAKGDFSHVLVAQRRDEVGEVVEAFNQTATGLTSLIGSIRESASQMNDATDSITTRNTRLEERAREQTKALNVAMEFIDGVQQVIDDNVAIAAQATGRAGDMANIATRSSQSVTEAVHEMQMVKQSSQKITDIISLIDGIAFQTNILALNAAVEAARAGEQGRGFAVVASEVRSLAGRSAQASKEIKELILASQSRVAAGTEKVQSISQIMESVTQTAVDLKEMVEKISSGSTVQSQHMGDMVSSVAALLAGNDNNVEIVSGMHTNLQDLRDTALALSGKVDEFRTLDSRPVARLAA